MNEVIYKPIHWRAPELPEVLDRELSIPSWRRGSSAPSNPRSDKIDKIKTTRYKIGVRVFGESAYLETKQKDGEYYIFELNGPEDVSNLINDLIS